MDKFLTQPLDGTTSTTQFVEPEIHITYFSDDLILADSNRCCMSEGFAVGYE